MSSHATFNQDKTLLIKDSSLLLFGVNDEGWSDVQLVDDFFDSFSITANLRCWEKRGAITLTCKVAALNQVQHEIVVKEDGTIDIEPDPHKYNLFNLELENKIFCTSLNKTLLMVDSYARQPQ